MNHTVNSGGGNPPAIDLCGSRLLHGISLEGNSIRNPAGVSGRVARMTFRCMEFFGFS